jgi:hypothetical protein
MKKALFILVILCVGNFTMNSQNSQFGSTAGFYNLSIKASSSGLSASADASGFFAGFYGNFNLSESLSLQPEIQLGMTFSDGESSEQILLPVMFKYYVSEKFNVQAGPQFDFVLNGGPGINSLGVGLGFGAGFDFTDKLFASGRYGLGLTNRLEDAPSGVTVKFNTIQIGIGFRF